MHSFSGNRLDIETTFAPTIKDIAAGLARIYRWGGAGTSVPWSVLQHALAIYAIAEGENPVVRNACLHHDDEEFVTGDIPRGFKTQEQSALGERIRRLIFQKTLHLPYPDDATMQRVTVLDDLIARAEADCLVHPRARLDMTDKWNGIEATPAAWDAVWALIDIPERELVKMFVGISTDLLKEPKLKALKGRG